MGRKKTTPTFLSILSSLFNNMSLADASTGTNQNTNSRIKLAHKTQSQAGPYTSAPTKECLEDHVKTHPETLRNTVKTKHLLVEFMGEKTE